MKSSETKQVLPVRLFHSEIEESGIYIYPQSTTKGQFYQKPWWLLIYINVFNIKLAFLWNFQYWLNYLGMTEISRHFISLHIMLSLNFSHHGMYGTLWSLKQLLLISMQLKYYSTYICTNGEDVFLEVHLKSASIKSFCQFHGCFQGPSGKWQTVKWAGIESETVSITQMDREVSHQESDFYNVNL